MRLTAVDLLLPASAKTFPAEALRDAITASRQRPTPAEPFAFYDAQSSVYSSKIEGEPIEVDSFFKYKFLGVEFLPDYTQRADDLVEAYRFAREHALTGQALLDNHRILARHLMPEKYLGRLWTQPMYVVDRDDRI